jgi:AAA+ ATPase superfamily predicted ATPase
LQEDFKSQVESRLDDLFREDDETFEPTESLAGLGHHPLKSLKAILLSVEWEITDSSMESLVSELKSLEDFYKADKIVLIFLRLLGSIAHYIRVKKSKSHPSATRLLISIYNALEKVVLSEGMGGKEKEKILLREVEKFKKLKEEIIRQKADKEEEQMEMVTMLHSESLTAASVKPAEDLAKMSPHELFAYGLEEIKEVIRAEFRALRAEIKLWRESR